MVIVRWPLLAQSLLGRLASLAWAVVAVHMIIMNDDSLILRESRRSDDSIITRARPPEVSIPLLLLPPAVDLTAAVCLSECFEPRCAKLRLQLNSSRRP